MDVGQISTSTAAISTAVKQLQDVQGAQMAIMKSMAESQQQMADILQILGIGQNLDVYA